MFMYYLILYKNIILLRVLPTFITFMLTVLDYLVAQICAKQDLYIIGVQFGENLMTHVSCMCAFEYREDTAIKHANDQVK